MKTKKGIIDRIQNDSVVIVKGMFKKESMMDKFIGFRVKFSSGETGTIEGLFGKTGKVKVNLKEEMSEALKNYTSDQISVILNYKQFSNDRGRFEQV